MKALFVALAGLSLACGRSPTSPSDLPLTQSLETSSYLFQVLAGRPGRFGMAGALPRLGSPRPCRFRSRGALSTTST